MKKLSVFLFVAALSFATAPIAMALVDYSPSQAEIDTFYQVSAGTLTGPDPAPPRITVGPDGTFNVSVVNEGNPVGWGDVQIGRNATIEGAGSAYYGGSWANLSGYSSYTLKIANTAAAGGDWFMANVYANTGWTDIAEPNSYYQNGWTWVAPGQSVTLTLDLSTAVRLNHVSSLGFNIGSNIGQGDYKGDDAIVGKATNVPDGGSSLILLGGVLAGLGVLRRKLAN